MSAAIRPPAWTERALCAQVGTDIFYPEAGSSAAEAKSVCAKCPVRNACLNYAVRTGERYGVWGGTTEQQRRRLQRHVA